MKLQLENIQGYLAHGLKGHYELSDVVPNAKSEIREKELTMDNVEFFITYCAPILRKLDLTKPITVNGVEILPIVELAKILKPKLNFDLGDGCSAISDDYYYKLVFYNEVFDFINESHEGISINQLPLFKWLYANLFDVDGLIDAGLAVDPDTLETNPYNS